jgi:hypothetical protein
MHPEQKPYGSPDLITQDMNDHLHWTCLDGFPPYSLTQIPEENDRPAQKINDRVVRYYESESAKSGMEKKT